MLMVSSVVMSLEDLFEPFSLGIGGGELPFPGGVTERRDLLEVRDGVRYGVSCGVGSEVAAGPLRYSSSVSQAPILTDEAFQVQVRVVDVIKIAHYRMGHQATAPSRQTGGRFGASHAARRRAVACNCAGPCTCNLE